MLRRTVLGVVAVLGLLVVTSGSAMAYPGYGCHRGGHGWGGGYGYRPYGGGYGYRRPVVVAPVVPPAYGYGYAPAYGAYGYGAPYGYGVGYRSPGFGVYFNGR